jgi:hypothetical protein
MSTAEIEVVEAFTSIGVAPDKAMADLGTVRKDIAAVQSDVNLLKWMVAFLLAIAVTILVEQFVR